MLIGIDPILNSDVIHALASMGHGDELVICDANFPATSIAAHTVWKEPIRLAVDVIAMLRAILTVLPIDTYDVEIPPVRGMQIVGEPDTLPQVVSEAVPLVAADGNSISLIERYAFYEAAAKAFVVIQTIETRPYGNFVIRKGVV